LEVNQLRKIKSIPDLKIDPHHEQAAILHAHAMP